LRKGTGVKELIEYMAKALVDDPSQVYVEEIEGARQIVYQLHVAPEDMGRVIGKEGRVANAMRTLLRVVAVKKGKRAILEIV
jgi:predicted RNA-binding protein YlqC (UPF0109 family)